ncbi:MAG TPA: V-type ATP synthase subunit D [Methanocella sp.]|nr:V-type ATP synthase subunit D [Methanocella sp.]
MEQVKPTRMELMKKKDQIKMAEQGRDLLRQKMDVLIREFFQLTSSFSQSRDELEAMANEAYRSLLIAQAVDDSIALKSAAFATPKGITLDVRSRNIMGVPVPVIEKKSVTRNVLERGYGVVGTSGRIDETAEKFEMELNIVLDLAEKETAMRRLGAEVQASRRRVNALEQVMIPELKQQAKYIKLSIEEREREDLFRLKKVKKLLQSRHAAEAGGPPGETSDAGGPLARTDDERDPTQRGERR